MLKAKQPLTHIIRENSTDGCCPPCTEANSCFERSTVCFCFFNAYSLNKAINVRVGVHDEGRVEVEAGSWNLRAQRESLSIHVPN